jgi:hypothetical protein
VPLAFAFRSLPPLLVISAAALTLGAGSEPAPPGLAATARQLQVIHPPEERDVPPAARSLMTVWKQQIRDFTASRQKPGRLVASLGEAPQAPWTFRPLRGLEAGVLLGLRALRRLLSLAYV